MRCRGCAAKAPNSAPVAAISRGSSKPASAERCSMLSPSLKDVDDADPRLPALPAQVPQLGRLASPCKKSRQRPPMQHVASRTYTRERPGSRAGGVLGAASEISQPGPGSRTPQSIGDESGTGVATLR